MDTIRSGLERVMSKVTISLELFNLYLESGYISDLLRMAKDTSSFWIQNCSLDFSDPLSIDPSIDFNIKKIYVKVDPKKSSSRDIEALNVLFAALTPTNMLYTLKTVRLVLHTDTAPVTASNVVKSRSKRQKTVPLVKPSDGLSALISDAFPNTACLITQK